MGGSGDATATLISGSNYGITGEDIVGGSTEVPALPDGQASDGFTKGNGFGAIFNLDVAETLDPLFEVTGLRQANDGARLVHSKRVTNTPGFLYRNKRRN